MNTEQMHNSLTEASPHANRSHTTTGFSTPLPYWSQGKLNALFN